MSTAPLLSDLKLRAAHCGQGVKVLKSSTDCFSSTAVNALLPCPWSITEKPLFFLFPEQFHCNIQRQQNPYIVWNGSNDGPSIFFFFFFFLTCIVLQGLYVLWSFISFFSISGKIKHLRKRCLAAQEQSHIFTVICQGDFLRHFLCDWMSGKVL